MRKPYIIAPEGCRWTAAAATSPESAYMSICCFYLPETRIAVIDPDTMKATIYTRTLDDNGNLLEINTEEGPRA